MSETKSLQSRILKTADVVWRNLMPLQNEDFKLFSPTDKERLKASLTDNSFIQPFYVWYCSCSDRLYCLDGYHRTIILEAISNEGISVPASLPAVFIDCANIDEAAKLVLLYSSQYARITPGGFESFMKEHNLDTELLKMELSIPGITDIATEELPYPDELVGIPKDKPAAIKITFKNVEELERVRPLIEALLESHAPGYLLSVSAGEI